MSGSGGLPYQFCCLLCEAMRVKRMHVRRWGAATGPRLWPRDIERAAWHGLDGSRLEGFRMMAAGVGVAPGRGPVYRRCLQDTYCRWHLGRQG